MLLRSIKLGIFLASKEILRSGKLTTFMIVFVMCLTFLNLVVVRGILVGIPFGAVDNVKNHYYGQIFISNHDDKKFIQNSNQILTFLKQSNLIKAFSVRHIVSGKIQTDLTPKPSKYGVLDEITASVAGINPLQENLTTELSKFIIEGEFLNKTSSDEVVIGAGLWSKYSNEDNSLKDLQLNKKVNLVINGQIVPVKVIGIIKTKSGDVDRRVYINSTYLQKFISNQDFLPKEIAIKLLNENNVLSFQTQLINLGFEKFAKVQTASQAMPGFLEDIVLTFELLGSMVGVIGIIVAFITVFIVIFVNAITKRKFIGILKGIGISSLAIEISYILQAIFYAFLGTTLGLIILYGFLVPYFQKNPLDFPFSNGLLVAGYYETFIRTLILYIATCVAGFLPARYIVKQNTLDAILGR